MSCKSTKTNQKKADLPVSAPISTIKQGVQGLVTQILGNQMPSPESGTQKKNTGTPYLTTVFFYEPTNINQVNRMESAPLFLSIYTKMVASVSTDSTGAFKAALPVGTYSVFVQVDKKFFANTFDIRNNISLVSVEEGKLTDIKIKVNNAATY
jgi:hypothetical protein